MCVSDVHTGLSPAPQKSVLPSTDRDLPAVAADDFGLVRTLRRVTAVLPRVRPLGVTPHPQLGHITAWAPGVSVTILYTATCPAGRLGHLCLCTMTNKATVETGDVWLSTVFWLKARSGLVASVAPLSITVASPLCLLPSHFLKIHIQKVREI